MSLLAIILLAFSMAADAFAAAIARGCRHRPEWPQAIRTGLVFGGIEGITPLIGWSLGRIAANHVEAFDHWIAFALLTMVGARMIHESMKGDHGEVALAGSAGASGGGAGWMTLIATAVGTSIDAAAVGVGLAMIEVNILLVSAAIGLATTLMATLGLRLGGMFGDMLGRRVELASGFILIAVGAGILLEHTGYLG